MTLGDAIPGAARIVWDQPPGRAESYAQRRHRTWPASRPAPTIAASGIYPASHSCVLLELRDGARRRFTVGDLLAIQGFPAGYRFPDAGPEDTAAARHWRVIGNAVPPPLMAAVSGRVADALRSLST